MKTWLVKLKGGNVLHKLARPFTVKIGEERVIVNLCFERKKDAVDWMKDNYAHCIDDVEVVGCEFPNK